MVVPAPPERTVQFVDVRDLGRWLVELLERDEGGAFNATRSAVSWQELIDFLAVGNRLGCDAGLDP